MTHNKKASNLFLTLAAVAAFAFGLSACDSNGNGDEQASADSASTGTAATSSSVDGGTDYSNLVTPMEVRDGAIFGELTLGNPDAPVTIIEYASLTCPHCADFDRETFPQMKETYIKNGQVKWVYRNYVRDNGDLAVSMLTRCYGKDKVFDLMTFFFERQREWLVEEPITEIAAVARRAGINRADFDACLNNTALQSNMIDLLRLGQEAGVRRTPTFFINGEMVEGAISFEEMSELVEDKM